MHRRRERLHGRNHPGVNDGVWVRRRGRNEFGATALNPSSAMAIGFFEWSGKSKEIRWETINHLAASAWIRREIAGYFLDEA